MCIKSLLVTACPGRKDWDCACVGIDNDQCHQACLVNMSVTSTPFCHFAIPWGPVLKSLSPHFSVHLHFLLLLLQRKNTPSLSFFLPYKNNTPLYTSSLCPIHSSILLKLPNYQPILLQGSLSKPMWVLLGLLPASPRHSPFPDLPPVFLFWNFLFWPPHTWQVKFSKTSLKGEGGLEICFLEQGYDSSAGSMFAFVLTG